MNLDTWARKQIKQVGMSEEITKQFEAVFNTFSEQGHSGTSASYCLSYLKLYVKEGYDSVKSKLDAMLVSSEGNDEDSMQRVITKDIMDVVNLFKEYNFSEVELNNLVRLLDWKPIVPLTGSDDEWNDTGDNTEQNKLCSAVFRENHDNSTAHYLYGRVYSDNGGVTWFTTGGRKNNSKIHSSTHVDFPFWVPDKSEYVYLNGEDSDEIITDEARIKELADAWRKERDESFEVFSFVEVIAQIKTDEEYMSINGKEIDLNITKSRGAINIDFINKKGEATSLADNKGMAINNILRFKKIKDAPLKEVDSEHCDCAVASEPCSEHCDSAN